MDLILLNISSVISANYHYILLHTNLSMTTEMSDSTEYSYKALNWKFSL